MTYKNRFITSDTHFGHRSIIEYEDRPYFSVENMNNQLIINWNKRVKDSDLVYLLGDVFIGMNKSSARDILDKLNGDIILVMGNHDKDFGYNWFVSTGRFKLVTQYPIIVDGWFILSHEPLYLEKNSPYVNIYGHVHGDERYKDFSSNSACVCVERTNYFPIDFDKVKNEIKIMRDKTDNHRSINNLNSI